MADLTNAIKESSNNNDGQLKDPMLTLTSPYYLPPAENPGAILVTPAMNGNNYDTWSKKMKYALLTKNKIN